MLDYKLSWDVTLAICKTGANADSSFGAHLASAIARTLDPVLVAYPQLTMSYSYVLAKNSSHLPFSALAQSHVIIHARGGDAILLCVSPQMMLEMPFV